MTSPISKKQALLALAEVLKATCPAERDILMCTGEYTQWKKDVTAIATLFDYTTEQFIAFIRGDRTYRQIDAERLKDRPERRGWQS